MGPLCTVGERRRPNDRRHLLTDGSGREARAGSRPAPYYHLTRTACVPLFYWNCANYQASAAASRSLTEQPCRTTAELFDHGGETGRQNPPTRGLI